MADLDTGLPAVAVVTMARDEGAGLARWVAHYGAQVGHANLLVVDDHSTDGSTADLPCPVVEAPPLGGRAFEATRMRTLSAAGADLLRTHDAVIFCDVDELIVPDPGKHRSIRHYVAAREGTAVAGVVGLNVVHHVGHEPPLDPAAPILGQRRLAKLIPLMCKPSVKWVEAPWAAASHGIRHPFEIDPDLWMFHVKFADRDHLRAAAERRRSLVELDGRGASTNWAQGADRMVALLDEVAGSVPDASAVPVFTPPLGRLRGVVKPVGGIHRASGQAQIDAMRSQPMVRIPGRFVGAV